MTTYNDRLQELRDQVPRADRAVRLARKQHKDSYADQFRRLGQILAYASLVLEAQEGDLLSDQAHSDVSSVLSAVESQAEAQPQSADGWASQLLEALARMPLARGQDFAQLAREAAQTFQRSAVQRLADVRGQIANAKREAEEVKNEMQTQRAALEELITQRRDEIDGQLKATTEALDADKQRIEQTTTEQAEVFRTAQEERASEFQVSLEKFAETLDERQNAATQKVESAVAEIEKIHEDVVGMAGAIGLQGTAKNYEEEFTQQRKAANIWRWITIGTAALAVGAALLAAGAEDTSDPGFVSRILISVTLGLLATYAARQSARHREREEVARELQLELAAFSPFIEPLPEDEQIEERVQMTRKTFGAGRRVLTDDNESGPNVLSLVMRHRRAAQETNNEG